MNRRMFLQALAAAGGASFLPQSFSLSQMYRQASAATNYAGLITNPPDVMPQVINIFLYGGPSELAGNLSNIVDIEANSQMKYVDFFPGILTPQGQASGNSNGDLDGSITPSGFWGSGQGGNGVDNGQGAGGDDMQTLVDADDMTVYRTMMKRENTSQSHRECILMSQKGSLDVDFAPGFGYKLAALISENWGVYKSNMTELANGDPLPENKEELLMPFISLLDGDTRIFDKDSSTTIPLLFNGISVNDSLGNPFSRNVKFPSNTSNAATEDARLEALVQQTLANDRRNYADVIEAFKLRQELEGAMAGFDRAFSTNCGNNPPPACGLGLNSPADTYPNTSIARRIRAAVTLAVENPSSLFITIGGSFGGWDDHNNGVDRYPARMRDVFAALVAAMAHIKGAHNSSTPIKGMFRKTDNIIINVFGDFGRRVNLNSSLGWNHGNNQNLYTLGGGRAGLRTATEGAGLGKVVGTTVRVGPSGADGQYTEPAPGSYEFDPRSIAANLYRYFGVDYDRTINEANPDPLTAFEDPNNPGQFLDHGVPAIDETQT